MFAITTRPAGRQPLKKQTKPEPLPDDGDLVGLLTDTVAALERIAAQLEGIRLILAVPKN